MTEQEVITDKQEALKNYPELMICDMDMTIILQGEFYRKIYSTTLEQTIFEAAGENGLRTLSYYRDNFEGKGELALGALGIPFSKWAVKLNEASVDDIIPQPDVVEKFRSTPSKKVVFTGSPKEMAYKLLTQFGFDPEKDFDAIFGWEEPEISPLKWNCSPFVFKAICQRMGVDPLNTWSIGDNWESDLLPAQLQGITTIQINKMTGNPDFRFASIADLIDQVNQNNISVNTSEVIRRSI